MDGTHPTDLIPIRVRVLDREYPLKVRAEDEGFTRQLAEELNERLATLRRQIPNQPNLTLSILAALRLAEENARLQSDLERMQADMDARAEALVDRLDEVLSGSIT